MAMLWLGLHGLWSQPLCTVARYDERDGVPSSHVTQLLQDDRGFMWFSTWNGLCRYDGYEFHTFKPAAGDGCQIPTDRIRDIALLPGGRMLCRVDDDYAMFSLRDYRFRNLTAEEQLKTGQWTARYRQSRSLLKGRTLSWTDSCQTSWTLHGDGRLTCLTAGRQLDCPLAAGVGGLSFAMVDGQGALWALGNGSIYRLRTAVRHTRRLAIEPRQEVKSLFADRQGRYWVATKGDRVLRLYDGSDDRLLGCLGSDGRLHPGYTPFGAAVYCMYQAADGTLWLGTKPDGLFRLSPERPEGAAPCTSFRIARFPFPADVYHLAADKFGRLWVATLGGGIYYADHPDAPQPRFSVPRRFPAATGQRVRRLHFTRDGSLLAASGSGLWVARLEADADRMLFRLHQREGGRAGSLSCSAVTDVAEDSQGRLFVGTESGGINQIVSTDLLADTLSFRHLGKILHTQGSDVVQSLALLDGKRLMAVGSRQLTLMDSSLHARVLDANYLQEPYRFSEAAPLALSGSRWLFALMDGAFVTTVGQLTSGTTRPRIVLTSASIQGGQRDYAIERTDTVMLPSGKRSLTVRFAALDYNASGRISYAFRLSTDGHRMPDRQGSAWHYIGHDRSATLLDLEPGTYLLEIRSTNVSGEWLDNIRSLTIIVTPTFWEAWYGRLLVVLLCVALLAAILYTYLYIRRIKRQHQQTLDAYLALLNKPEEPASAAAASPMVLPAIKAEDDAMLKRVMKFIEENIANADIGVGDLAAAAAVSRSGLQRKLKQTMGVTPQELLSEARIKRACQLLRHTDKAVAEIGYACGFNNPKYFSKCFKQSTGKTPSEFKNAL